jgi:hypothetical protein
VGVLSLSYVYETKKKVETHTHTYRRTALIHISGRSRIVVIIEGLLCLDPPQDIPCSTSRCRRDCPKSLATSMPTKMDTAPCAVLALRPSKHTGRGYSFVLYAILVYVYDRSMYDLSRRVLVFALVRCCLLLCRCWM